MEQIMNTVAIVIIAYNRPDSLKRLLASLAGADYPEKERIPLVISIDKGDNAEVIETAESFIWEHGEKSVICRETNLGLKQHVLLCGDYTQTYDGVIMLEDDLYVSPSFYAYASAALDFAEGQDTIGGVSLYNHLLNVHVREPFEAVRDDYDNWYFQFASSWGQAFCRAQWSGFREWLRDNDGKPLAAFDVPENVSSWSDKSWLKYYIKYLIETKKYFMYPYVSLTTNFSEEGAHAREAVTDLQVPLAGKAGSERQYRFCTLWETRAVYDAFFENMSLKNYVEQQLAEFPQSAQNGPGMEKAVSMEIDLYGYKPVIPQTRYFLTSKSLPYKRLKSYGRSLRPMDANIFEEMPGNDFYLYDTEEAGSAPKAEEAEKYLYHYRALKVKAMRLVLFYRIKRKLRRS